ncbi:MAG: hypothetical protein NT154_03140, partial [Verrucomicrobia bacterium]|nr:hypothetical protein [Verrucomicrobiota bacterium]
MQIQTLGLWGRGTLLIGTLAVLTNASSIYAADRMASAVRQQTNFNREWRFLLEDHPGAEAVTFDDSKWAQVGLPHSFSLPYFLSDRFYVGYGWYRKSLEVPANW